MGWEPALEGKQILKKLQWDFSKAYLLLLQSIYFATDFDCSFYLQASWKHSCVQLHSSHLQSSMWLRYLKQQGSNLVGTSWAESKMVMAWCDQDYQNCHTALQAGTYPSPARLIGSGNCNIFSSTEVCLVPALTQIFTAIMATHFLKVRD